MTILNYAKINEIKQRPVQSILIYSKPFNGQITYVIEHPKVVINGTNRHYHTNVCRVIKSK